jgi:hypothetical protein
MRCGPGCRYGSAYPPRLSVKADLPARQPSATRRHTQCSKEPFCYLDCAGVDVHAVKAVLDSVLLGLRGKRPSGCPATVVHRDRDLGTGTTRE